MRLRKAIEDKVFDIRLRDKLIGEGKLLKSDVDKYLEELTDDANQSQKLEIDFSPISRSNSPLSSNYQK